MAEKDSVDRIVGTYFRGFTKQPFEYKGHRCEPKPLKVSPKLLRGYTCPPDCGACCSNFSLDFLPDEPHPFEVEPRIVKFNGRDVTILTDFQKENKGHFCKHLNMKDGRCQIHPVKPFSCDFELIRVLHSKEHSLLISKLYERRWSMTRIDGDKGALCEMTDTTEKTKSDVVMKLYRLQDWTGLFGLSTWIPDIIKVVERGHLTKQITFDPEEQWFPY